MKNCFWSLQFSESALEDVSSFVLIWIWELTSPVLLQQKELALSYEMTRVISGSSGAKPLHTNTPGRHKEKGDFSTHTNIVSFH